MCFRGINYSFNLVFFHYNTLVRYRGNGLHFCTEQCGSPSGHYNTLVRYRGNDLHFCTEQCGLANLPIITIHWLGTGEMVYLFVLNIMEVPSTITIHWLGTSNMVYFFVLNSTVVLSIITILWLSTGEMVSIFVLNSAVVFPKFRALQYIGYVQGKWSTFLYWTVQ